MLMPSELTKALSTSLNFYLDMANKGIKAPSAKQLRMMSALDQFLGEKELQYVRKPYILRLSFIVNPKSVRSQQIRSYSDCLYHCGHLIVVIISVQFLLDTNVLKYLIIESQLQAVPSRTTWRRPLMVRQPQSEAVPSTGGRLHPSF